MAGTPRLAASALIPAMKSWWEADTLVGLQPWPGDDGEAARLQALLDGGDVAGVDVSAAGSALDGVSRTGAEQGDLARLSQGEGAIGAQQHHALGGESADGGEVVDLMSAHTHLLQDVS